MAPKKTKPVLSSPLKGIAAVRRKILSKAIKETGRTAWKDINAAAKIQATFNKEYDQKVLPVIKKEQSAAAKKSAAEHIEALSRRYATAKKEAALIASFPLVPLFPYICTFIEDFENAASCTHDIPVQDVDDPAHVIEADCDCILAENKAKPILHLRGSDDEVVNKVTLVSKVGFNIDDDAFPSAGKYCITPTVLLSGYWIRENWGSCRNDVTSGGDFTIDVKVKATQLGGSKVLVDVEDNVFDWETGEGFTGTIDKTYNIAGSPSSEKWVLHADVDPSDGDVYVEVSLEISASLYGYGRYLIDMNNSNSFYFWVERVELSKCKEREKIYCYIGGPSSPPLCYPGKPDSRPPICYPGGPDSLISCKPGTPDKPPQCYPGEPNTPNLCRARGPIIEGVGCKMGGLVGCTAGPPLHEIESGEIYESGIMAIDLEKVPQSEKRAFTKMIKNIISKSK